MAKRTYKPRTPRDFTDNEWNDIAQRLKLGHTWVRIADDYAVRRDTLARAGRKRGLNSRATTSTKDAVLPSRSIADNPQIRKALSQIAKESGIDDPESVIVACRDRIAEITDIIEHRLTGGEDKYEGMPRNGMVGTTFLGNARSQRLTVHAAKEEIGLRDLLSLLKDIGKLESERLQYHKPKLAAAKVEHSGKVDFSKMTDEQLQAIINGADPEDV